MPQSHLGEKASVFEPLAEYTDAESEWLRAMEKLRVRLSKDRRGRMPTCSEVLAEAIRIGYRKLSSEQIAAFDRAGLWGLAELACAAEAAKIAKPKEHKRRRA